jgi:hypothetical protein
MNFDSFKQHANVGNPVPQHCWQQYWGNCDKMSRIRTWCTMRCRDLPVVVALQPLVTHYNSAAEKEKPLRNKIPYIIAEFGVGYCLVLRKAKRGTEGETACWLKRYRSMYCITRNVQDRRLCLAPFSLGKLNTAAYFLSDDFPTSTFHPPSHRFYLFTYIYISTRLLSFPPHYSLPYSRNYLPTLSLVLQFLLYSSSSLIYFPCLLRFIGFF